MIWEFNYQQTLDYENKKELDFVLEVFDGKFTVSKPINIKIDNVNDLKASISLASTTVHEGSSINSNSKSNCENSNLTYSLSGNNSNDFVISTDGQIKHKFLLFF